jgi:hypothetical protein
MDAITATMTLITLATFIKDLIEVGESIKQSLEKVRDRLITCCLLAMNITLNQKITGQ